MSVTITSTDNVKVTFSLKAALMSQFINDMLSDHEHDQNITLSSGIIPFDAETLQLVAEYCEHHKENPPGEIEKPLKNGSLKESVPEWDFNFINIQFEKLKVLATASNFLNIVGLVQLSCAQLCQLIRNLDSNKIRAMFSIENDLSTKEVNEIIANETY